MNILIVDDTKTDRLLLSLHLTRLGHQVIEAEDGPQALAQYGEHEHDLDLILMDVQIPSINGFDTVKTIRQRQKEKQQEWMPIIFLSASVSIENIERGMEVGGDDYLTKPVHYKVLAAKMRTMQRITDMRRRLLKATYL